MTRVDPDRVQRALVDVCGALGAVLPIDRPLPDVWVHAGLAAILPGHQGATWPDRGPHGTILLQADTDDLLRHELGHWRASLLGIDYRSARSERWARLAEGRPLARLAAWLWGGPA